MSLHTTVSNIPVDAVPNWLLRQTCIVCILSRVHVCVGGKVCLGRISHDRQQVGNHFLLLIIIVFTIAVLIIIIGITLIILKVILVIIRWGEQMQH